MSAARGLLRRDRQGQSRPRYQDGQDAGRRVRRGRAVGRPDTGHRMTPGGALGVETVGTGKRFGDLVALNDVSVRVRPGTVHALLGENGAGKSTLVKCIMGYHRPDSGKVLVDGKEVEIATPRHAQA